MSLRHGMAHERLDQHVRDIVGERSADQEFHRQIVDPLGVFAPVDPFGEGPALGKQIAHGSGDGLEALARVRVRGIRDVVKNQVTFVERIFMAAEFNWPTSILATELCQSIRGTRRRMRRRLHRTGHGMSS